VDPCRGGMASRLIRAFRRAGTERGHQRAGRGRRQKWHTRTRRARWFKGRGLLRALMMLWAAFLRSFSCLRGVRSLGLPIGSTAAVIALATFSAPVKALGFHWRLNSFNGQPVSGGVVKGAISGLLDNTSSQTAGLIVAVDSAPNTPAGGWINDGPFSGETGFSVLNGEATAGNAFFGSISGDCLYLRGGSQYEPGLSDSSLVIYNAAPDGVTTYAPQVSAVPDPLPLLGAASALGWSRKVRNRLRNAQRSAR